MISRNSIKDSKNLLVSAIGIISSFFTLSSNAEINYLITYPPIEAIGENAELSRNYMMNHEGTILWTEHVVLDPILREVRTTFNLLQPVNGEYLLGNTEQFAAPVVGAPQSYLVHVFNNSNQFSVAMVTTGGASRAWYFNGGSFEPLNTPYARDLDNPPTYDPAEPVFNWRNTNPTALTDGGTLYGIITGMGLDTGPPLNVMRSGAYLWNSPLDYSKLYDLPGNAEQVRWVAGPNILGTALYEDRSNPKKTYYLRSGSLEEIPGMNGTALSINNKDQVFASDKIYLPVEDYGLPAGLSTFDNNFSLIPTDSGHLYRSSFTSEFQVYQNEVWEDINFIDPERPGFVPNIGMRVYGINKDGEILAGDVRPVDGVNVETHLLLSPIGTIDGTVSLSPKKLEVGETVTLKVTMTNKSDEPFILSGVYGETFQLLGTAVGGLEQLANPPPTNSLLPTESFTQEFPFIANQLGTIKFNLQVAGFLADNTLYLSEELTTEEAEVIIQGDLLIKRESQREALFGEDDVYQEFPLGQQRETISVIEDQTATFDIKIENDSSGPGTFFFQAEEDPDDDWDTTYTHNETDIKAEALSQSGYSTGELQPGESILIKTTFTPTTAAIGGEKNVLYRLFDEGGTDVDTLESITRLVDIPIELTARYLLESGLDSESILAGNDDINAPLIPIDNTDTLLEMPEVAYGLVADGVTPLLFHVKTDISLLDELEEDLEVILTLDVESGGTLLGDDIQDRLRVLENGSWVSGDTVSLNVENPVGYAYLTPIQADDLFFTSTGLAELGVTVMASIPESGDEIGDLEFYLRKPPIILIHGYNTAGNWGSDFENALHVSRPRDKVSFVQTGRYGQQIGKSGIIKDQLNKLNTAYINTIFPLKNLVPLASSQAFDHEFAKYKGWWAVTRHDVIAHSQGGVLTRMLCADTLNQHLPRTFRSESDFFRGRFHRIVTVGSPQNGSRTLYYMRALLESKSLLKYVASWPTGVAQLMVTLDVAQYKFDPFAEQIAEINSPNTHWTIDPAAQFHIIRTTVNGGNHPDITSSPSDAFLGLSDVGGQLVLPRGSDGVVDFDSMGCHAAGDDIEAPDNVFTIVGPNIAHASAALFGGEVDQVKSNQVAAHARGALDQRLQRQPDQIFATFPTPPLLTKAEKDKIDLWASQVSFDFEAALEKLEDLNEASELPSAQSDGPTIAELSIIPSVGKTPLGPANWTVETYDENGVTYGRFAVQADESNNLSGSVEIPETFIGEVVIYANYITEEGEIVVAPPILIHSQPPTESDIESLTVIPSEISLIEDTEVIPELWANYDNGSSYRVFISNLELQTASSDPDVVDVSNPNYWYLANAGTATVSGVYEGLQFTSNISVIQTDQELVEIGFAKTGSSQVEVTWPAILDTWNLQKSFDLNIWETITDGIDQEAGLSTIPADSDKDAIFYRLISE